MVEAQPPDRTRRGIDAPQRNLKPTQPGELLTKPRKSIREDRPKDAAATVQRRNKIPRFHPITLAPLDDAGRPLPTAPAPTPTPPVKPRPKPPVPVVVEEPPKPVPLSMKTLSERIDILERETTRLGKFVNICFNKTRHLKNPIDGMP